MNNRNILDKKRLLLILLITVIGVVFAFYFGMISFSRKGPDFAISNIPLPVTKNSNLCRISDSVEYLRYTRESGDKFRNNKFGLYIYAENKDFFDIAKKLVNSNGGDWGYVLIPYNVKDLDKTKWTRVFDQLSEKHLIPIIQLWDVDPDKYKDQTKEAAEFLNGFLWPTRQRYISVYNEPNDAKFWRGKIDPEEYAIILNYTISTFKQQNLDFFMINGAFNTSAANSSDTMDAEQYMIVMNNKVPGIFNKLDGWASHSYPQPNFAGSPDTEGRWGIRAYVSELDFLKEQLGVTKDLPVFITETGWAHAEGQTYDTSFLTDDRVGENFKRAFEKYWLKDDRVMAVIPFTIKYDPPYDHFSWVNPDNVPYNHYDVVKSIRKVDGNPPHTETARVSSIGCSDGL